LKNIPFSEETIKWADSDSRDPSTSREAINARIATLRSILKRPDPPPTPSTDPVPDPVPVLEKDTTDRPAMSEQDHVALKDLQEDLRGWWTPTEKRRFYERLGRFREEMGEEIMDSDEYDFWIDEWSKKAEEMSIYKVTGQRKGR
jgi:hypothetical protein